MRTLSAALVVASLALAACGHHHRNACDGARDAHVAVLRVDESSQYMRNVVVHVGVMPDDKGAIDPDARNAGVRVLLDSWKTDRGSVVNDQSLTGPSRAAIAHVIDGVAKPPAGHALAYERTFDNVWRAFYVETKPIVDGSAIVSAEPIDHGVRLELSADGAKAFEHATADAVGHKLAIVVGDEVVSAPVVATAIHSGKLEITSHDKADDSALRKQLGCTR
jgi:hypothetical protein